MLGLYTNVSWKSVLSGIIAGLLTFIPLVMLLAADNSPFIAADLAFEKLDASWTSFCGVAVNLIFIGIGHIFFGPDIDGDDASEVEMAKSKSDDVDKADDGLKSMEPLSSAEIKRIMSGIDEPLTKYYGVFVYAGGLCIFLSAFHWIGEVDPALEEEYGAEGVKHLLYNGYVRTVIGGFPDWAFASIMWYIIATSCGIVAAHSWNTDAVKERARVETGDPVEMDKVSSVGTPDSDGTETAV